MRAVIRSMACVFAGGLMSASAALAQDKPVELRFSHWVPTAASDARRRGDLGGSRSTKPRTARSRSRFFRRSSSARRSTTTIWRRDGIVDISHVNPGYEPGRFPIVAAVELPFLFTNAKEGSAAMDAWYRRYADREMKDVRYCLAFRARSRHVPFRAARKCTLPTDMSGMKFRPPNAVIANWMTLAWRAQRPGRGTGNPRRIGKGRCRWRGFAVGFDGSVRHRQGHASIHIDSPIYISEQVWVLNKAKYDALSAAQKKVMDEHCSSDWALKIATPWAEFEVGRQGQDEGHGRP